MSSKIENSYKKRKKAHKKRTKNNFEEEKNDEKIIRQKSNKTINKKKIAEPKIVKEKEHIDKKENEEESKKQISRPDKKREKENKTKKKKSSLIIIIISIIVLLLLGLLSVYLINEDKKQKELERQEKLKNEIISKYNEYVVTNNNTFLYEFIDGEYIEVGEVGQNVNLELEEIEITHETKYFKIKDTNYFIEYKQILPSEKKEINDRYKSFVVFNKNIITKDKTSFYKENGDLFITINKSYNLPIIINEKDKYGVEFYNQLLYVKKEDVKEEKKVTNTKEETRTNIRTLTYHTVYIPEKESCTNSAVCHPIKKFEEQMKYLHDKKYLTLTMEELEMFLDGKIRVPKKTIVITLDDGRRLNNSVPIVEKYGIYSTFFVITSKYSIEKYKDSKYARFESHTDDLHHNYKCNSGYYGGQMLCEKYDNIIKDLKLSQEKLGGSHYFAYPFFDSNAQAIKALKETGFKMAFIGEYTSNGYSTGKTDRFQLRRKTIFGTDGLSVLKSYLAESE